MTTPQKLCFTCKENPAHIKAGKTSYCKPCRNARERANYNPEADRARHLKYWYGITAQQYDDMLNDQQGLCAVCEVALWTQKKTNVDHDHQTGKVRGILCSRCNLSIGLIENTEWQAKAFAYLRRVHQ